MAIPRTFHIALHGFTKAEDAELFFSGIGLQAENLGVTTVDVDEIVNAKRQERARKENPDQPQARPGKLGDTGRQVIFYLRNVGYSTDKVPNVNVSEIVTYARTHGYKLVQASRARKPVYDQKKGERIAGKFKWVVRFVLTIEQDEEPIVDAANVAERLERLLETTVFEKCVVWQNAATDTINLTRVQEGKPRRVYNLRFDDRTDYAVDC